MFCPLFYISRLQEALPAKQSEQDKDICFRNKYIKFLWPIYPSNEELSYVKDFEFEASLNAKFYSFCTLWDKLRWEFDKA